MPEVAKDDDEAARTSVTISTNRAIKVPWTAVAIAFGGLSVGGVSATAINRGIPQAQAPIDCAAAVTASKRLDVVELDARDGQLRAAADHDDVTSIKAQLPPLREAIADLKTAITDLNKTIARRDRR